MLRVATQRGTPIWQTVLTHWQLSRLTAALGGFTSGCTGQWNGMNGSCPLFLSERTCIPHRVVRAALYEAGEAYRGNHRQHHGRLLLNGQIPRRANGMVGVRRASLEMAFVRVEIASPYYRPGQRSTAILTCGRGIGDQRT